MQCVISLWPAGQGMLLDTLSGYPIGVCVLVKGLHFVTVDGILCGKTDVDVQVEG